MKKKKSDWKQFLKPNWFKILFTILIGVFMFGFLFTVKSFLSVSGAISESITKFLFAIFLFPLILCPFATGPATTSQSILCFISLILIFVYWYLISCLILWLWSKRSSKRKRK